MHRLGLQETNGGKRATGVRKWAFASPASTATSPQRMSPVAMPTPKPIERYADAAPIEEGWSAQHPDGAPSGFMKHLVNTAGAARFPAAHHDLIRVGLGLYGLDASGTITGLEPIGTFRSAISHLHAVPAGEPVGYGARDTADHERTIATVPVGYQTAFRGQPDSVPPICVSPGGPAHGRARLLGHAGRRRSRRAPRNGRRGLRSPRALEDAQSHRHHSLRAALPHSPASNACAPERPGGVPFRRGPHAENPINPATSLAGGIPRLHRTIPPRAQLLHQADANHYGCDKGTGRVATPRPVT